MKTKILIWIGTLLIFISPNLNYTKNPLYGDVTLTQVAEADAAILVVVSFIALGISFTKHRLSLFALGIVPIIVSSHHSSFVNQQRGNTQQGIEIMNYLADIKFQNTESLNVGIGLSCMAIGGLLLIIAAGIDLFDKLSRNKLPPPLPKN